MDKILHLIVGTSLLIGGASMHLSLPVRHLVVLTAAAGKEVVDQQHGGRDPWEHARDIGATMAGAVIGELLLRSDPTVPTVHLERWPVDSSRFSTRRAR